LKGRTTNFPKYGNNDTFVDDIGKEIVHNFYEEMQKAAISDS
jgi:pyruvate-formate lyase